MRSGREDRFLTGRGLALVLTAIVVLAFVIPPVLAREVQARRVARAATQVQDVARALSGARLSQLASEKSVDGVAVLSGVGDSPAGAEDHAWSAARTVALRSVVELPPALVAPDPWLRALQVNISAARTGGRCYVLSAGPNGIIETRFDAMLTQPTDAGGDDIAAPLP